MPTHSRQADERGFTLIELMVVVLIIAILIAIAIPTFLGARSRAQDRAAQSSLRNALTAAKTAYTDTQDWSKVTATELAAAEPSLTFVTAASTGPNQVSVASNANGIGLAAESDSGTCFAIWQPAGGAEVRDKPGSCTAPSTAPASPSGW